MEAEEFFKRAKDRNCIIVLSDLFLKEVGKHCFLKESEVLGWFKDFKIRHEVVFTDHNILVEEAKKYSIHYPDNLHAAFAIISKCSQSVE